MRFPKQSISDKQQVLIVGAGIEPAEDVSTLHKSAHILLYESHYCDKVFVLILSRCGSFIYLCTLLVYFARDYLPRFITTD